jgi:hypothetical protein
MRLFAFVTLTVITGLATTMVSAQAPAAAARPQTVVGASVMPPTQSVISGAVASPMGEPLSNTLVQARNLLTGEIAGSVRTSGGGEYTIASLPPGSYILEIVDDAGTIIGTSSYISAAAGATAVASIIATSGAMSVVTSVSGVAATLTTTAVSSVKAMAAAAGVAGVVTPPDVITASPSR